jgi:HAD superfamily hydrolase (TIGR01509 family)
VTNLPSVVAWAERPHTAGMAPTHPSSGSAARRPLEAVVFDLDGVLIEGEEVWDAVRQGLVRARGGHWVPGATATMMGMSSPEWSRYMAEELGVPMAPAAIIAETVAGVAARYEEALPLVPGAVGVVRELAQHWPLGLASSANRPIIELVLDRAGLTGCFRATVSSEEVARGKPAPDVYLSAAAKLGADPATCVAIEDSANGLRSAAAARMTVVAVPNPHYPPPPEALALARATVRTPAAVTPELIAQL